MSAEAPYRPHPVTRPRTGTPATSERGTGSVPHQDPFDTTLLAPAHAAALCSGQSPVLRRGQKRGRTLLEPELKEMFERQKAKRVKYPPDMDNRADKADTYWATHLGFPGWR